MMKLVFVLVVLCGSAYAQALPPAGLPPQGKLPGTVTPREREPVIMPPPPVYYGQPRETRCNRIGDTVVCRSN